MCKKVTYLVSFILVILTIRETSATLIGHWKLDENNGLTTMDSSGYGNDGRAGQHIGGHTG